MGGVFLIIVEEELTKGDGGEAVGCVFGHGGVEVGNLSVAGGAGVVGVEIIFVVIGGESGDLRFD